jgi:RNA polymerase sigma-70 factor (ECF subfamily)
LNLSHTKRDIEILRLLKNSQEQGINFLFEDYYELVVKKINRFTANLQVAEDLAQDLFLELWQKREVLDIKTSLHSYLSRASQNRAINYFKAQKIEYVELKESEDFESFEEDSYMLENSDELIKKYLDEAIKSLPDRCRLVFCMSRFEDKTYQQIANELTISVKTVENQITKAFKHIRQKVKELGYVA